MFMSVIKKVLVTFTSTTAGLAFLTWVSIAAPIEPVQAAECSLYETLHPNFPLDGSHLSTGKCSSCASCHAGAHYLGTPKSCTTCHSGTPAYQTTTMSVNHFLVTGVECNSCHNTTSFTATWTMTHSAVTSLTCTSCHDGTHVTTYNATGKDANHMVTQADCGVCHAAPAAGSNFDPGFGPWQNVNLVSIHTGITNNCYSCHNDVIAKGKSSVPVSSNLNGHPVTSNVCETCHTTQSITNGSFKCAMIMFNEIHLADSRIFEKMMKTV